MRLFRFDLCLWAFLLPSCYSQNEKTFTFAPLLSSIADSIRNMDPAVEYDQQLFAWAQYEDMSKAKERSEHWVVVANPSDPYTSSSYVVFRDGFRFGYDGIRRIRDADNSNPLAFEIDSAFRHPEAPRIRVVPNPFYYQIGDLIDYILSTTDPMTVSMTEHQDFYELDFVSLESSSYVHFGVGHVDPHGAFFPRSFNPQYTVKFGKRDLLPFEVFMVVNDQDFYREVVSGRKSVDLKTLDLEAYLPEGFFYENQKATSVKKKDIVGNLLPAFSAEDTDGKMHTNADYKGRVLVLVHSAIGCGVCQMAVPVLEQISKEYSQDDLAILSLTAWGESLKSMKAYRQHKGFSYPFAKEVEPAHLMSDLGNDTALAPWLTVVDRDGQICGIVKGFSEKDLRNLINKALNR